MVATAMLLGVCGCFAPVEEPTGMQLLGNELERANLACEAFSPGCGANPLPAAGCYTRCATDADCGAGQACREFSINPCADPGTGAICDACGMNQALCVRAAACSELQPGCGPASQASTVLPASGCFVTCTSAQDCAAGQRCVTRWINPCVPASPGAPTCDACGAEQGVCE
jgi:hypothetical protein